MFSGPSCSRPLVASSRMRARFSWMRALGSLLHSIYRTGAGDGIGIFSVFLCFVPFSSSCFRFCMCRTYTYVTPCALYLVSESGAVPAFGTTTMLGLSASVAADDVCIRCVSGFVLKGESYKELGQAGSVGWARPLWAGKVRSGPICVRASSDTNRPLGGGGAEEASGLFVATYSLATYLQ